MIGIIKQSLGIIRTLLVWGIIGAAGIIVYQHFTSRDNSQNNPETINPINNLTEEATAIKKQIARSVPVIKDKLGKAGKIIIKRLEPEEEEDSIEELLSEPAETTKVTQKRAVKQEEKRAGQQEIFDRQVAIVNDLMQ